MRKDVILTAVLLLGASALLPGDAKRKPVEKVDGKRVFEQHCASCHAGGGNRLKPTHPVAGSKQLANSAVFKSYLSEPPGHMPYYADVVNDRDTLKALYDYCRTLKVPSAKEASLDTKLSVASIQTE